MLTIRAEQMSAFDPLAERALCARIHEYVTTAHPETVASSPREEVRARVEEAVAAARGFGLTWEVNIADFAVYSFTVGPLFYTQDKIQSAMQQVADDAAPDHRFMQLGSMVGEEDWEEARRLNRPAAKAAAATPAAARGAAG